MPKRILFLSKGEHSASTRYRALNYFPMLEADGWVPRHMGLRGSSMQKPAILRAARQSDVVVLLRHALSFPFLQMLRWCAPVMVFDFDDAIFLRSSGEPSPVREKRFKSTVARCDAAWAGNDYLAGHAGQFNDTVTLLPTSVDTRRYAFEADRGNGHVDMVWIGSSSTSRYLRDIVPFLEKAAQQIPNLRLKIIADFELQSPQLQIVNIPWSQDGEVPALANADVGIAPMTDDAWTRGKCALKVLQYMACGLPVVSSDAGANRQVIRHGETGYLVDGEAQWLESLKSLAQDAGLRERMGAAGKSRCQQHYSQDACFRLMRKDLDSLLNRPPTRAVR